MRDYSIAVQWVCQWRKDDSRVSFRLSLPGDADPDEAVAQVARAMRQAVVECGAVVRAE